MNYSDWERMKIAGNTKHNRQIDEMRKNWETHEQYDKIIQELKTSNSLAFKQAEEAKKSSRQAKITAWISIAIAGCCAVLEVASLILKATHIL